MKNQATEICFAILMTAVLFLGGCDDESIAEMEQQATQEVAQEMAQMYDGADSYPDEDYQDSDSPYSMYGADKYGSSGELEGTIAVVTILTDDKNTSWDMDDQRDIQTFDTVYDDIRISCDWITKSCKEYGRDVNFIWDWKQHEELIYDAAVSTSAPKDFEGAMDEIQSFIRQNIDSENIKKSLGANGIIYLACVDTPGSNNETSSTVMWERYSPIEEEVCLILMRCDNEIEPPSCFAHEMLHTFGAPDLYMSGMYGITQDLVDDMEAGDLNDIMRTNDDPVTKQYLYDRIKNEITDITAYYIGLTDHSDTVDEWGLEPSDYEIDW